MATCVICENDYTGYGNNALPVESGTCCDGCNTEVVLPARIQAVQIRALVDSKPYPDFDSMTNLLLTSAQFKVAGKNMGFVWSAEYGAANHGRCRRIYESYLDPDTCRAMGQAIYTDGGMDAMRACFYILLHFSKCHAFKRLDELWDGIGQWSS